MRDLGDGEKVVAETRHDVAGLGLVEVAEGEFLQVSEEESAHIGFDAGSEHMAPFDVVEGRERQRNNQQSQQGHRSGQLTERGMAEFKKVPGGQRDQDGTQRPDECHRKVEGKQRNMGFVECAEAANHFSSVAGVSTCRKLVWAE